MTDNIKSLVELPSDGDSKETRAAFRAYDAEFPVSGRSAWQIWRDACAYAFALAAPVADSAMAKDAERLNFVIDKQGIVVSRSGNDGVRRYQLYRICEYGTGVILSGKDRWFDAPRDAIDAAIAASAADKKKPRTSMRAGRKNNLRASPGRDPGENSL
ncbi:hypothetical protein [Paraburkholderia hospita]|uniref:hypothetical protein n=1 Tax=Paraburkholderia hospita TaxID=169430 RepID=UPI000B343301|nr:hypothetical protein [Paraburkholderia hospita]OUL79910.1 hypothetical protein CA603_33060 [Paraburkholderia hospita]